MDKKVTSFDSKDSPEMKPSSLTISCPLFAHNALIPRKYTCQGENINPAITIGNLPPQTKSLALIVDDPDAPGGNFDHWIVWNIPPGPQIGENSIPGVEGKNDYNITHYKGPCPPSGTHRYFFKVYALDMLLELMAGSGKKALEDAMLQHVIAYGELIGLYKKT